MSLPKYTKFLPLVTVAALVLAACTSGSPGESAGESAA